MTSEVEGQIKAETETKMRSMTNFLLEGKVKGGQAKIDMDSILPC